MPPFLAAPLFGLARWIWVAGAAVALVAGFLLWLHLHTQAAIRADRNAANAEATATAREADERAHAASEGVRDDIQRSNDDAKEAADGSDDPLRAGLDSLRAEKNRDRQASRRAD